MKIYEVTVYVITVFVVQKSVFAKSFIFNKFSNGPGVGQEKSENLGYEGTKENLEQTNIENLLNSYKRSADDYMFKPAYKKSPLSKRKRSPYGLVYNQGKPIGILEPISQSFEYSTYTNPRDSSYHSALYKSQWFPVKRELDLDEERDEVDYQNPALHSSNYANVLAKFKVNNKVKHRPYQDFLYSQVKRDAGEAKSKKEIDDLKKRGALDIGELQSTSNPVSKVKRSDSVTQSALDAATKDGAEKIQNIEENLKDVMGDMGLVEKDKEEAPVQENEGADLQKREIYFEDEDLENGLNKIGLTKESHYERNKKENCPGKTKSIKSAKPGKKSKVEKSLHKKAKKKLERKEEEDSDEDSKRSVGHGERKANGGDSSKVQVANYQYEGEAYIRRRRQEKEAEKAEDSAIMKGLETSGDLTVSGNKSPLVAVTTNGDDFEYKKSQEKRNKEELDYEKRLERNIQAKIDAIKEEVKREISKLKTDDDELKDMQRKKREIANTLLDEETSALDPGINIDQKLVPYVRKRRDLDQDLDIGPTNEDQGIVDKRNVNDEQESDDDKKIADNEDSQDTSKITREMHAETDENQFKRDERNAIQDATQIKKPADSGTNVRTNREIAEQAARASMGHVKGLAKRSQEMPDVVKNSDPANLESAISESELAEKEITKRNEDADSKIDHEISSEETADDSENKKVVKRSDQTTGPSANKHLLGVKTNLKDNDIDSIIKRNTVSPLLLTTSEYAPQKLAIDNSDVAKRNEKPGLLTNKNPVKTDILKDKDPVKASGQIRDARSAQNKDQYENEEKEKQDEKNAKNERKRDEDDLKESSPENEDTSEIRIERSPKAITKEGEPSYSDENSNKENERDEKRQEREIKVEAREEKSNSKDADVSTATEETKDTTKEDRSKRGVQKSVDENSDFKLPLIPESQLSTDEPLSDAIELRSADLDSFTDNLDQKKMKTRMPDKGGSGAPAEAPLRDSGDVEREYRKAYDLTEAFDAPVRHSAASSDENDRYGRLERKAKENQVFDDTTGYATPYRKRREAARRYDLDNRRRYLRRKRDELSFSESNPDLMNYRADNDGEMDDEGDEMDDDGFNDQTYVNKRQAEYDPDNENYYINEDEELDDDYPLYMDRKKRNALRHLYADDEDAEEAYDNYLFDPNMRKRRKRENFEQLVAVHGGGAMLNHLAAVRERNMQPLERSYRRKRLEKLNKLHSRKQNIAELSDSDIFGGLPQSYEGELSRFKRVKRYVR